MKAHGSDIGTSRRQSKGRREDLRITAGRREATVLLVIDQTEELLGYGENVEERRFLPLLRAALEARCSPLMAICTLRSRST